MNYCHHEDVIKGNLWWWCDKCVKGEREVRSEDVIVTLPLTSRPAYLKKPLKIGNIETDSVQIRLVVNILKTHRSMGLSALRRRVKNFPKLRRALKACVRMGILVVEKREVRAQMYIRKKNITDPEFIPAPMREQMEKVLMHISSPIRPISRSEVYRRMRMDAETLDEVLRQLMKMNVIGLKTTYRLYYHLKEVI